MDAPDRGPDGSRWTCRTRWAPGVRPPRPVLPRELSVLSSSIHSPSRPRRTEGRLPKTVPCEHSGVRGRPRLVDGVLGLGQLFGLVLLLVLYTEGERQDRDRRACPD